MPKYEIEPTDYENMSVDEANRLLSDIDAELYEAGKEHPYFNRGHPQHQAHVDHKKSLHMASARKEGEPFDLGKAKAEQDEADMQALKQQHLVNDAQAQIDALVALGFTHREVPDNVMPFEVTAWRIQRLAAEGKFGELTPMMEKELTVLDSSALDLFHRIIRDEGLDAKSRARHIELILERCCTKNREIYGVK